MAKGIRTCGTRRSLRRTGGFKDLKRGSKTRKAYWNHIMSHHLIQTQSTPHQVRLSTSPSLGRTKRRLVAVNPKPHRYPMTPTCAARMGIAGQIMSPAVPSQSTPSHHRGCFQYSMCPAAHGTPAAHDTWGFLVRGVGWSRRRDEGTTSHPIPLLDQRISAWP